MLKKNRIFVTGHKGLVGSALLRRLDHNGYKRIITVDKKDLDLRDQKKVLNFFKKKKNRCCNKCCRYSWWYLCKQQI